MNGNELRDKLVEKFGDSYIAHVRDVETGKIQIELTGDNYMEITSEYLEEREADPDIPDMDTIFKEVNESVIGLGISRSHMLSILAKSHMASFADNLSSYIKRLEIPEMEQQLFYFFTNSFIIKAYDDLQDRTINRNGLIISGGRDKIPPNHNLIIIDTEDGMTVISTGLTIQEINRLFK
jgi:hypothetical protein